MFGLLANSGKMRSAGSVVAPLALLIIPAFLEASMTESIDTSSASARQGKKYSGSSRHEDLTGQRFGRLVAMSFVGKTERRKSLWLCRCDCGEKAIWKADTLKKPQDHGCPKCVKKGPQVRELAEKLWERVVQRIGSECWEWTGATFGFGYGIIRHRTLHLPAHRVSYALANGEIPDGLCVLHRCDNPLCVRPDHLFLGTRTDNAADREAKGRGKRGEEASGAVLTETAVLEIKSSSLPAYTLARKFKVSRATISDVICGRTWKHVTGTKEVSS